jgi:hypothetical protein
MKPLNLVFFLKVIMVMRKFSSITIS